MDPPYAGAIIEPAKCRLMSVDEKKDLVRELSKRPQTAPDKLQSWSRRDIVEILCADLGRERKYTGLSKQRMLDYLFRVVTGKSSGPVVHVQEKEPTLDPNASNHQYPAKRQRKSDNPSRLPIAVNNPQTAVVPVQINNVRSCRNIACRAILSMEDKFCRRCSCCICFKYDDNKDPTIWLSCSSDHPMQKDSCGLSCHLECALKDGRTGILPSGQCKKLDGAYYCPNCRKQHDLLRSWKKQLMLAKEARRLDILCYRIFLGHKVLFSTEKYSVLHKFVDIAKQKLEAEVGSVAGHGSMGRGIVSRLTCGAEVQKLCAEALDVMQSKFPVESPTNSQFERSNMMPSSFIKFEPITPTCYVIKVTAFSNSSEFAPWEARVSTSSLKESDLKGLAPGGAGLVDQNNRSPKTNSGGQSDRSSEGVDSNNNATVYTDLNKSPESDFEYCENPEILDSDKVPHHPNGPSNNLQNMQIVAARVPEVTELEEAPGLSASALDEEPNSTVQAALLRESSNSMEQNQRSEVPISQDASNATAGVELALVPRFVGSMPPTAPRVMETGKETGGRSFNTKPSDNIFQNGSSKPDREPGNSSNKRSGKFEDAGHKDGCPEATYEYCVRVVRWLETEGYIETNFRVKFLTWYSLRATPHDRKIVSVYVDTLINDPASLCGQLTDTFSEAIYSKKPPSVPSGFCMNLWH
ncbi:unnamed protein product [Triticum turgidum subsp. durum]|uniref:Oberon PHD finger domain-containing protein n=1 Tax=Triticum turgidum subsp. durum TaxID=4567 RepID=A0A9R0XWP6_TRITD|nr:unnamed protein product [Triticum turgidum subsp. durum]